MKHTKLSGIGLLLASLLFFLPGKTNAQFIKGADISWHTEMTASGYKWYNDAGTQQPLHTILKAHKMTAIRLRVWVNPAGGWCNQNDVVAKAVAAKNAGMDVMIDFHYSDSWADPGKQTPPSGWGSYNINQMMTAVWNHTVQVLTAVKNAGVTPKWVQIGNETNDGILWPLGKASTNGFQNYAWIVNTGNNAAKSIFPSIKTIVHIANGDNRTVLQWNLDGLRTAGATYDIIGLSLYPAESWSGAVNSYASNLTYLKSRYGKSVMLVEVGMNAAPVNTAYNALVDILNKTKANGGLGVFYWEPAGYNNWKGYSKHCWLTNGRPTTALDAFLNAGNRLGSEDGSLENIQNELVIYPNPFTETLNIQLSGQAGELAIYDTAGRLVYTQLLNPEELNVIRLEGLTPGIYLSKVVDGSREISRTLVKN